MKYNMEIGFNNILSIPSSASPALIPASRQPRLPQNPAQTGQKNKAAPKINPARLLKKIFANTNIVLIRYNIFKMAAYNINAGSDTLESCVNEITFKRY
jgi:hypothetical protein